MYMLIRRRRLALVPGGRLMSDYLLNDAPVEDDGYDIEEDEGPEVDPSDGEEDEDDQA